MKRLNAWFALLPLLAGLSCSAGAADNSPVVAKIGNTTLTEDQMRSEMAMQLYQIEKNAYMMKKNWVDQKAMDILFNQAAKDAGLTRQKWEEREIDAKAPPVDEERAKQLMGQFARPGVDSMDALKQARAQVVTQNRMTRQYQLFQELSQKTPVQMMVTLPEAPRIDVTYAADDPVRGNAKAPVTIVEFTDFQCPFCARSQATLKQIEQTYPQDVKLVARQYPLPFHDKATPAAEAALCAKEQNKFWEFRDKLFDTQQEWSSGGDPVGTFKGYAKGLKLNEGKFNKCLDDHRYASRIKKDMSEGQRFGVSGTPAFFVNGEFISGAQPFDAFNQAIKSALAKKS